MGRCLTSFKFHQLLTSTPTFNHQSTAFSSYLGYSKPLKDEKFSWGMVSKPTISSSSSRVSLCTRAALSKTQYPKVGAQSTGSIPATQLLPVVEKAAKTGAQVVMDAVNKPRKISYKGLTDLVTETDKMSEAAILDVVRENFKDHLILGEEGGVTGEASSDYLWCIDPLDGTTNFAHGYPSFAVSVGVLFRGKPAVAAVVEFVGGAFCWNTRTFTAIAGGGAFCNGQRIQVSETDLVERSLLVTGFGYEHDDAWVTNINLFKEFTDISRGVRRLGAAAVDMCHVAIGAADAYWEYRLKPWDMAAGVLIVEEAGGAVTCMDGGKFCVYDRSVLVSNGSIHSQILFFFKRVIVDSMMMMTRMMKAKFMLRYMNKIRKGERCFSTNHYSLYTILNIVRKGIELVGHQRGPL